MITIDLRDPKFIENYKTINELRKSRLCTDEELQELYDRQMQLDREKGEEGLMAGSESEKECDVNATCKT